MIMKLDKCLFLYKMSLVLCYKNPARTDYLAFISNIGSFTVVTNKPQFVLRYLTSFWESKFRGVKTCAKIEKTFSTNLCL